MTRSILITGCSSGIGLDAARTLTSRGWRVFAACRKPEDCARLKGEGLESPRIDLDDSASIAQGLQEVLQATGGTLDALFNNAAIAVPGALEDVPRGALEAVFSTNLFGLHELTNGVLPVMRAQGHGRVVNCSSVLGLVARRWRGAYVASKFALEGLTDALRMEMKGTGIEVALIEPGSITTKFRANSVVLFERWVDWRASPRRGEYDTLLKRFYEETGPDRFELPPSAVTEKLIHAIESPRPRARYAVTIPAHGAGLLKRGLSTRMLDRILGAS